MGIQGLLPVLKSIAKPAHVSKYRGQRVAVDAYAWLHKGAYACSMELCEGIPTDRFVTFCMQRVNLMRHNGVIPVIVFDGDRLPMKGEEEGSRHRSRQENRDKAAAHMAAGNKSAAYECYQRAVDITPLSAKRFIEALKLAGVEFIVAPYEADAQMAYLAMNGLVDAVITEDSDLLPYGCPRVFFKMDKTGDGQEIAIADLGHNRDLSFVGFSHQMFLEMCIFAGCDFLKALPGIGIKNAHKHVRKLKTFIKVCRALRFNGTSVPRGYEADFQRALWTFHHQRVFCPQSHKLVHLRELPAGGLAMSAALVAGGAAGTGPLAGAELDFLGPQIPDDLAYQVAVGNVDPISKEAFPELQPAVLRPISGSTLNATSAGSGKGSGQGSGPKRVSGTKRPLPVQANNITSYFASQPTSCTGAKKEFTAPRMSALAASAREPAPTKEPPASSDATAVAAAFGLVAFAATAPVTGSLAQFRLGSSKASAKPAHRPSPAQSASQPESGRLAQRRSPADAAVLHMGIGGSGGHALPAEQRPAQRAAHHLAGCSSQPDQLPRGSTDCLDPALLSAPDCEEGAALNLHAYGPHNPDASDDPADTLHSFGPQCIHRHHWQRGQGSRREVGASMRGAAQPFMDSDAGIVAAAHSKRQRSSPGALVVLPDISVDMEEDQPASGIATELDNQRWPDSSTRHALHAARTPQRSGLVAELQRQEAGSNQLRWQDSALAAGDNELRWPHRPGIPGNDLLGLDAPGTALRRGTEQQPGCPDEDMVPDTPADRLWDGAAAAELSGEGSLGALPAVTPLDGLLAAHEDADTAAADELFGVRHGLHFRRHQQLSMLDELHPAVSRDRRGSLDLDADLHHGLGGSTLAGQGSDFCKDDFAIDLEDAEAARKHQLQQHRRRGEHAEVASGCRAASALLHGNTLGPDSSLRVSMDLDDDQPRQGHGLKHQQRHAAAAEGADTSDAGDAFMAARLAGYEAHGASPQGSCQSAAAPVGKPRSAGKVSRFHGAPKDKPPPQQRHGQVAQLSAHSMHSSHTQPAAPGQKPKGISMLQKLRAQLTPAPQPVPAEEAAVQPRLGYAAGEERSRAGAALRCTLSDHESREYVSNASDASEPEQEMAAAHSGASGEDGDAGDAADHLPGAGPSFYSMAHMASFSRAAKQAVSSVVAAVQRRPAAGAARLSPAKPLAAFGMAARHGVDAKLRSRFTLPRPAGKSSTTPLKAPAPIEGEAGRHVHGRAGSQSPGRRPRQASPASRAQAKGPNRQRGKSRGPSAKGSAKDGLFTQFMCSNK